MLKRVKSLRSPESLGLPVVLAIFGPFSFSTGAITWSITSRRRYLGTRGEYIFGHRPLPVSFPLVPAAATLVERLPPLPFGHRPLPVSFPFAGASPAMGRLCLGQVAPEPVRP